jgi:hypothetical protein
MKLIKLKLQSPFQGPGRGPSNVFTWSYIFVTFEKAKYCNHNRFSLLSLPTVTLPIISGGVGVAAGIFVIWLMGN